MTKKERVDMLEKIYYDSCRVALNLDAEKANDLAYDIFKLLCEEKTAYLSDFNQKR